MEATKDGMDTGTRLPSFLWAMVVRPQRAFASLEESGRPSWLLPVTATFVVIWLAAILSAPIRQKEAVASFDLSLQQMGDSLPQEQMASMDQARSFSTNALFLVLTQGVTETIGMPILWASAAGVLYFLCLAVGGRIRFGGIWRLVTWASAANLLGRITLLIGTLASGMSRTAGLQYLVNTPEAAFSPSLAALGQILARFNIFDIWFFVLIGVGVVAATKTTPAKGVLVAAALWVLSVLPPAILAAAGAAIGSAFTG